MSSIDTFTQTYTNVESGARVFSYVRQSEVADGNTALPVLVLLHGFPQNNSMWEDFVDEIPQNWDVLIPDLPGYGNSTKPVSPDGSSRNHSKAEWSKDIINVVDALFGSSRKIIAYGHDRGARLAYRIALEFPLRVAGLAVLDIVPTIYVWDGMQLDKGHKETKRSHHWVFLASPTPLPETMIASNPEFYYNFTLTGWIGADSKDAKEGRAQWVKDSISPYLDPVKGKDRIIAGCEDYRAGASIDIDDDLKFGINPKSPNRQVFSCPLLVLSSVHLRRRFEVDTIWKQLGAPGSVESFAIGGQGTGHFLVNEAQEEVGMKTREWLKQFV